MEVSNSNVVNGSLQISTDVIGKIAKLAATEIDGVVDVCAGSAGMRSFLGKVNLQKPVSVELLENVAEITVSLTVCYGSQIPAVCEKVQENVKSAVQNMTSITVARVNIVVVGVLQEPELPAEEE
ncbi:Asp23/Gls24 family envelope stress response protein [Gemmiger sp. An194]|uniref:Asp23/Gls24 family envelope stress response protein n=1 Tax=Gemmiger sp. An194 TaxID=1965582 RepID=UPI000B391BBB|nr:Asp23/Gls24 family envelope stress response protein [Gemmiger sp. An194]OUP25014.1 Asp23/Gls24 family envelope stress response protein [Gemmiger sp. An194]